MAEQKENKTEYRDSYTALAQGISRLGQSYSDVPINDAFRAFIGAGGRNMLLGWPDIQNRRVKNVNTRPANFSKDEIARMVENPDGSEKALRAVSSSLSWSTKTYDLILHTYPDIMSYYWFITISQTGTADKERKMREYTLAYEIAEKMQLSAKAHEITGLAMKYGKVPVTLRLSIDKSHGKVNYAFLQQLPMDWCRIVGFNNGPGKYTVAFNMMYFMQPGTDWRQFGDLFKPYMPAFIEVVDTKSKYVYSSATYAQRFKELKIERTPGHPQWEQVGAEFMYWVTLPAEDACVFEIDDTTVLAAPPMTGLMVSMTQIPNYEAAQMEVILNPLTSVLTGSLETYDPKASSNEDPIRVSPTVRSFFEALWYQMLERNNTSGIGLFLAPANDLKLQTLSDTVANTDISSTAYSNEIEKAGLPALIPTTNDPKVGVAELSAAIHANYARPIYWAFERLMDWIFDNVGFKTKMRLHMFGNAFDRENELENARKGMTLGILTDTLKYDAMMGLSPLEDISTSEFIAGTGLLDNRIPLVSSYSAKQSESNLPPQAKQSINPGGRPPEDGSESSQKTEKRLF